MARKSKQDNNTDKNTIKLKDFIEESKFESDDIIFIHIHNVAGYEKYKVSDLSSSLLNKRVITMSNHFGGQEYGYNATMIIVE